MIKIIFSERPCIAGRCRRIAGLERRGHGGGGGGGRRDGDERVNGQDRQSGERPCARVCPVKRGGGVASGERVGGKARQSSERPCARDCRVKHGALICRRPRAQCAVFGREGGHVQGETAADASRTIEIEETDASRTRPQPFLPGPGRRRRRRVGAGAAAAAAGRPWTRCGQGPASQLCGGTKPCRVTRLASPSPWSPCNRDHNHGLGEIAKSLLEFSPGHAACGRDVLGSQHKPVPRPRHSRATPAPPKPKKMLIARTTPAPCPRHARASVL
eukprot:gene7799-biopygen9106